MEPESSEYTRALPERGRDSSVPAYLQKKQDFHLIDAGLLVNVAYPSILGDKRDIDLIIVPEYSAGNIFEVSFVIFGAVASTESNMEENRSQSSVRQSQQVCAGEQEYVHKRKQEVILKSLNGLGINCSKDSVPHIALLGSGGGQRAEVALVGTLYQMKKDGLLDSVLYLGGVSGSAWAMSSLYSDPEWSGNMDRAVSELIGPGVDLEQVRSWLGERAEEKNFSLSDVWGAFISYTIMKKMDKKHVSDEAISKVTNPYPIYCAVEKHFFSEGPEEGRWFELSPHEAGFPDLGLFIETSLLGSKFKNKELKKKKAEMDMVKVQGICGSALADRKTIIHHILEWLSGILSYSFKTLKRLYSCGKNMLFFFSQTQSARIGPVDPAEEELDCLYQHYSQLLAEAKNTTEDPEVLAELDKLQQLLEDERHDALQRFNQAPHVSIRQEENGRATMTGEMMVESVSLSGLLDIGKTVFRFGKLIMKVLRLLWDWEWGTTNNFLCQHQDSSVPAYLQKKQDFHLIDAGLHLNVGYASILGDKRDIDLIIVPEFSAGNIFETLTLARDYAAKLEKPFPEIDEKILEDKDWPKDCYVIEGKGKEPTIVFMPLFNRNNCKDAGEVKAKMDEFSTFQMPYSEEMIKSLMEIAKENMKRNKETLQRELSKAAERRRSRSL